ncbi:MAG: hypothetical protein IKJ16_06710 [Agathobacter sp.]|nr:hypothetical protein [Agathobacter sp.]
MYVNERDEISYHEFLRRLREKNQLPLGHICKGICTVSGMHRFEKGMRVAEKLMRDRFLARLGIVCEKYEDYLRPKEYVRWEQRQSIIKAIEHRQLEKAKAQLQVYASSEDNNCIHLQFVDVMSYQIGKLEEAPQKIQLELLYRALKRTIPNVKQALEGRHLLCDQEINLIAELISLEKPKTDETDVNAWRIIEYEKLIVYIENSHWEKLQKAKIYPKLVWHICISMKEKEVTTIELQKLLKLCNVALALIKDTGCAYYQDVLTEIFHRLRARLCEEEMDVCSIENKKVTADFTYLYYENECYDMVRVIEARRRMLGFSRKKLAEGICAERTVVRFEREGQNPSLEMVRQMFEKMGLCAEYRRARVITNDVDLLLLSDELIYNKNQADFKSWEVGLKQLEKSLCLEIPQNKQELCRLSAMLRYQRGDIEREVYCRQLKKALEYTLPTNAIHVEGEKYLTKNEREIIDLLEKEKN